MAKSSSLKPFHPGSLAFSVMKAWGWQLQASSPVLGGQPPSPFAEMSAGNSDLRAPGLETGILHRPGLS